MKENKITRTPEKTGIDGDVDHCLQLSGFDVSQTHQPKKLILYVILHQSLSRRPLTNSYSFIVITFSESYKKVMRRA